MVPGSDNPNGAEDQQERLIRTGWVIGFVDGEGCFSVGFVRQPNRGARKGYAAGYQVFHRFVVAQGAKSHACLEELREFFGAGRIYRNRRNDNHKEDMFQFVVGRRDELVNTIIPFFRENPLRTSKREDFERFDQCMEIVQTDRHRTVQGLVEIAEITQTMNHRKSRKDLIRILRGHTPNTPITG
jgi:LAGLIDADG DNA endonuclease family protein